MFSKPVFWNCNNLYLFVLFYKLHHKREDVQINLIKWLHGKTLQYNAKKILLILNASASTQVVQAGFLSSGSCISLLYILSISSPPWAPLPSPGPSQPGPGASTKTLSRESRTDSRISPQHIWEVCQQCLHPKCESVIFVLQGRGYMILWI